MANLILKKDGTKKEYIYKSDIQNFLNCGYDDASKIFDLVKAYEIELYELPFFKKRVPQDLFHEFRRKKKKQ